MASGFSILRVVSSISASYDPANYQAAVETESAECGHDAINLGQRVSGQFFLLLDRVLIS